MLDPISRNISKTIGHEFQKKDSKISNNRSPISNGHRSHIFMFKKNGEKEHSQNMRGL